MMSESEAKKLYEEIHGCARMGTPYVHSKRWHEFGLAISPADGIRDLDWVMKRLSDHELVCDYLDSLHLMKPPTIAIDSYYLTRNGGVNQYLNYMKVLDHATRWVVESGGSNERVNDGGEHH